MKTIIIKLSKAGKRVNKFSIKDNLGNNIATDVAKKELIKGLSFIVEDNVMFVTISSSDKPCCSSGIKIPISTITNQELADMEFTPKNSSSIWSHLTDTTVYNRYYNCTYPYIIEYPFSYQFKDEILQNIKDYTKSYTYLPSEDGVFDNNRKIQTDDKYFNKSIIYNDQQSSGILELVPKPINNLKEYMSYPKFNSDSKTITFTKSDNFYQYNTFWAINKDKSVPLFLSSCESLSIDKEVNQDNMDYSTRSFRKATIRAKDVKIRQILDNSYSDHLVTQFIVAPAQISYK